MGKNTTSHLNRSIYIILAVMLAQIASAFAEDKSALDTASGFVTLLNDIQKELAAEKNDEDRGVCERKIRLHVRRLKSFWEQNQFAYIAHHFSELGGDADGLYKSAYRVAFIESLFLMAKDKSEDAEKAFKLMKAQLQLDFFDGALALEFNSAMRAQADKSY